MSFFGTIGKVLGGVAKAGLSVVTHGVSDKVLGLLKQRGEDRRIATKTEQLTAQQEAAVQKIGQIAPRVRTTEILSDVRAGAGTRPQVGVYKSKNLKAKKHARHLPKNAQDDAYYTDASLGAKLRGPKRSRKAPKVKRARSTKNGGRKAPTGGLDLKRIASMWKAEGKPGSWLAYIKANSNIRKGQV
jgi:autonomous glycyl radical cofactor GrcA